MKYAWIESHRDQFSVSSMCRLLGVSSSGLHAWRSRPPSQRSRDDARLVQELRARHARRRGKYGRPRLTADLREAGIRVNHKRVYRLTYGQRRYTRYGDIDGPAVSEITIRLR